MFVNINQKPVKVARVSFMFPFITWNQLTYFCDAYLQGLAWLRLSRLWFVWPANLHQVPGSWWLCPDDIRKTSDPYWVSPKWLNSCCHHVSTCRLGSGHFDYLMDPYERIHRLPRVPLGRNHLEEEYSSPRPATRLENENELSWVDSLACRLLHHDWDSIRKGCTSPRTNSAVNIVFD